MGNGDNGGIGSGGGGRVAIAYAALSGFDPSKVTAVPGAGAVTNGFHGPAGGVGTVYLVQVGQPGQLVIDSHGARPAHSHPLGNAGDTSIAVGNLTISGAGVVVAPAPGLSIQAGNVSILSGGVLTAAAPDASGPHLLQLDVSGALLIDATLKNRRIGRGLRQRADQSELDPGFRIGRRQLRRARNDQRQ